MERVTIDTVAIDELEKIVEKTKEFEETIKGYGENPFKGW
jgi:quinone-modifying oxidoreductase subunit QmoB